MLLTKILQGDYTLCDSYYQIKLPLELERLIPASDPVRLLSAFVEGMDLSELYSTYNRIRKNQASPRQMLKIMIYSYMNHIYSSRDIERACSRDINFMYLLEGTPAPDHATIARFRTIHFAPCAKHLMAEVTGALFDAGELSGEAVFIDGTKIEANANKYTFVWKRSVLKNQKKVLDAIASFVQSCEEQYGIKIVYGSELSEHTLKRLMKKLKKIQKEENILFVYGSGKRKTVLQRNIEQLEEYMDKLQTYDDHLKICGDRNSYSKTDHDATFMRMKEDAMLNGQLKPGYNVQHGVDSEYIAWVDVSSHPTDTRTLIPFLKDMERHLHFKYRDIVADAGYEGEENYHFIEENKQVAYIKPMNYEISKTRKYRSDISRKENMAYDAEKDLYICRNGRELKVCAVRKGKTRSGYRTQLTYYRCDNCSACPYKTQCIKGNNCNTQMEERVKTLYVSKEMEKKRQEDLKRITGDYGTQLRMNRSIQAEGSFAVIKEDMQFRQYLCRGKVNVTAESIVMAISYNINKLHHKIQTKRTGTHLFPLKEMA